MHSAIRTRRAPRSRRQSPPSALRSTPPDLGGGPHGSSVIGVETRSIDYNSSAAVPAAASQPPPAVARRGRWTLGVVCTATALLLFNVTAPVVALPSIAADLRLSFTSQQWVLSSYALVLASLLLAGGALGGAQAAVPRLPLIAPAL